MPKTVRLSHRQNKIDHHHHDNNNNNPSAVVVPTPTLFLHGLDSSSHTWSNILNELKTPAVAIDLRGCGYSDLGDEKEFSPEAIVEDIHDFVLSHEFFQKGDDDDDDDDESKKSTTRSDEERGKKFVICGHSMGGRIAMSYAAKYPEKIAALVVEDMDIRMRPMSMNMFQRKNPNRDETIAFDRNLNVNSVDEIRDLFEKEGYNRDSVGKWIFEGRIVPKKGEETDPHNCGSSYYSEVNPAFRLLCYEQFFITNHGESTWSQIATNTIFSFPCHIMVAGSKGTVCDNESIWKMQQIMKKNSDLRMILYRYKDATHSIHNSACKSFLSDLKNIIKT